jgi:predicted MFS family arabinose efflux permease
MYAMVALGVGEMMGCIFIGQIVDRMSSKAAVVVDIIIIII